MQLKEFSLIDQVNQRYEPTGQAPAGVSPQEAGNLPVGIEATDVFKSIETVIPLETMALLNER